MDELYCSLMTFFFLLLDLITRDRLDEAGPFANDILLLFSSIVFVFGTTTCPVSA